VRLLLIAATLIALPACNQNEPRGDMTAAQVAEELQDMKIEPGQWDATNEIVEVSAPKMPGELLKQMVGRKTVVSNCITPEQAAKPSASFLAAQEGSQCRYQDWAMDGGKMSGAMTCKGDGSPGEVAMTMTGTYGSNAYDLYMVMKTSGLPGGMSMTVKAKTAGRRTGACTAT
jgi:hypothetical protein